jgi:hypothetical protein
LKYSSKKNGKMKKNILRFVPVLAFIAFVSCNTETTVKNEKPINNTPLTALLVPDTIANKDIDTFHVINEKAINLFGDQGMADSLTTINAYTIRAEELLAAMGIDSNLVKGKIGYNHIRVYPAYRKGIGFKLYIYPVEGANLSKGIGGYDMVFDKNGKITGRKKGKAYWLQGADGDEDGYGLDLNTPCPTTCPPGEGGN